MKGGVCVEEAIRNAIASAMQKLKIYRHLSEEEFQRELEWQVRNVHISTKNRIIWQSFEVGQRLLKKLCKSQHWRCYHCEGFLELGYEGKRMHRATFEHLVPLSKNGLDHPDNLVVACYNCNQLRGNKDLEDFNSTSAVIKPPTT